MADFNLMIDEIPLVMNFSGYVPGDWITLEPLTVQMAPGDVALQAEFISKLSGQDEDDAGSSKNVLIARHGSSGGIITQVGDLATLNFTIVPRVSKFLLEDREYAIRLWVQRDVLQPFETIQIGEMMPSQDARTTIGDLRTDSIGVPDTATLETPDGETDIFYDLPIALVASAFEATGDIIPGADFDFFSSDTGLASVDSSGNLFPLGDVVGDVTITATYTLGSTTVTATLLLHLDTETVRLTEADEPRITEPGEYRVTE